MNPERMMTQHCTLHLTLVDEDSERDDYGNATPTTVDVEDVPCLLQQSQNVTQRGETAIGSQIPDESLRLMLPLRIERTVDDEPVEVLPDAIDSITVDGVSYEVHGPPWRAFNPRLRRVTHVEATVRRAA